MSGGIKYFGSDASKPYPNPADASFATGAYGGAQYPAGASFQDAGGTAIPRYPTNIYYNVATNAQEVDEYQTLYDLPTCKPISGVTTCNPAGTPFTIAQIIASVDQGMFQHMMGNDPRPHYFHQTNLMSQAGQGDGLFFETINPLLSEYNTYFAANAPIEQPTMAQIGALLSEQAGWAAASASQITGSVQGKAVTVQNGGPPTEIPLTGTNAALSTGSPTARAPRRCRRMCWPSCAERMVDGGIPLWRVAVFVNTLHPDVIGRRFHLAGGRQGRCGGSQIRDPCTEDYQSAARWWRSTHAPADPAPDSPIPIAPMIFRSLTNCAPRARPTMSRFRCSSPTARSTSRPGRRAQPGGFTDAAVRRSRSRHRAADAGRRNPRAAANRDQPAQHLCRPSRRRAHPGRQDPARRHRSHPRRDLALRHARLHRARRPPAAAGAGRSAQSLFRLPGAGDLEHGGEVLKFMGDGLLAIFPIAADGGDADEVCRPGARRRARRPRAGSKALGPPASDNDVDGVRFGLALHVGHVLYGNIGGGNRLDFTCIGPAVNLAAGWRSSRRSSGAASSPRPSLRGTATSIWTHWANFPWRASARRRQCSVCRMRPWEPSPRPLSRKPRISRQESPLRFREKAMWWGIDG